MSTTQRVAITCETPDGLESPVSQHFGRSAYFTLVDLDGDEVVGVGTVANPAAANHKPGGIPEFIREQGATVVLAGGMGRRAVLLFEHFGVGVASGAQGTAGDALHAWLDGSLQGAAPCRQSEEHAASGGHDEHHGHEGHHH